MDFGSLLNVAQQKSQAKKSGIQYYNTKFAPPKKEERTSKTLSENIQKFLARKEAEEKRKADEAKIKKLELLALRAQDGKAKRRVQVMLKRTKSANKSAIEDAIDNKNTAVTLAGPSQPDEDDYGYESQEAAALYQKMMERYSHIPEEEKFSAFKKRSVSTNLSGTKDRVKAALLKEEEEANLPHKRKRKSKENPEEEKECPSYTKADYEKDKEKEAPPKPKIKRPPPPAMDFNELLKIAEKKQFEPIVIETKKPESDEPLLTKKQRKELEKEKAWREARESRLKDALTAPKKPEIKPTKPNSMLANGKIPKLNSAKTSNEPKPSERRPEESKKIPERRPDSLNKPAERRPEPIRSKNELSPLKKPISNPSKTPQNPFRKPLPVPNGNKLPTNTKINDAKKAPLNSSGSQKPKLSTSQTNLSSIELNKGRMATTKIANGMQKPPQAAPGNSKPKQFSPADARPKQFPPPDVRPKQFPPSDVRRNPLPPGRPGGSSGPVRAFPPKDVKRKPLVTKNRRILDDDDDEYDSELDDFIDDGPEEGEDYSKYISEIFGYDKSRYRDVDEDDAGMESNYANILKEEYISTKIGIMEDLEDIKKEQEEKRRKALMKKKMKR